MPPESLLCEVWVFRSEICLMFDDLILGLAETLRSEFLLYGITVHIFFPGNMLTPGLEAENRTKPKIVLKLEETDTGQTAEHAAEGLLQGKS